MQNSLRYNTAQFGSVVPLVWGTQRVSVNVIQGWNFQTTGSGSGKGGGAGKGKSGGRQYSVNVLFGICGGPVSFPPGNVVYANAGTATVGNSKLGLGFYPGDDGVAPDPVNASTFPFQPILGYSGTAYAAATPMQLGNAPVLPNLSVEVTGFRAGSMPTTVDANPQLIVQDMLYDSRIGMFFSGRSDIADWGVYCQSYALGMSLLMDKQQPAARWLEELGIVTVSAVFWSSGRLRIVPYSLVQNDGNGAAWFPNLTPLYNLTDDDFLPWSSGGRRSAGEQDPILITRMDVSQITNWMTIEILDRNNWYDPAVQPPVFDQASIELHGPRTTASVQAHEICNVTEAFNVANMMLRRKCYLRNTYKFRLGWRHMLLEPMDVVTLNDTVSGLTGINVRIIEIQEDDGGELTITAEDLV